MRIETPKTDWFIFTTTFVLLVVTVSALLVAPSASQNAIKGMLSYITSELGLVFIWFGIAVLFFLLFVALSPIGGIKLGLPNDRPDHSKLSWVAMLFSTGIGTTILYWGAIEWVEYYLAPPYEMPPRSEDALKWSTPYGMFHWGIIGWALYCFPAVCLGYAYHVHQGESLNLSTACRPILGGGKKNISARMVDVLFMVGLLGSSATGIGLTTPLITESFCKFFGFSHSVWLTMGAVGLVLVVIVLSVYAGLEKGIRKLSNLNMILLMLLLMLIVVFGPTKYIFSQGAKNGWFMLTHLAEMGGIYYPSQNKAFTESWTVFYWAWWLSLGPFVGMFICKISRGRTLRQLILSVLFFGTLGCTICVAILSGFSMFLEQEQGMAIIDSFEKNKHSVVIQIITSLPLGDWILPLFFLLCISFAATTYDSASYTLAAAATMSLKPKFHPARWHRVTWAILLGSLPLTLLLLGQLAGNGEQVNTLLLLQTASVVVSIPILFIGVLMIVSFFILLKKRKLEMLAARIND